LIKNGIFSPRWNVWGGNGAGNLVRLRFFIM